MNEKMGKFSNALGIWDLKIGDINFELRPALNEVRKFRNLLMNEGTSKKKSALFDAFSTFMTEMIRKEYSDEPDEEIKVFVEVNINTLFEEAMIAFKWTTPEQLEKSKSESLEGLKKAMSND